MRPDRPGLAQPLILPVRVAHQNRPAEPRMPLLITQSGQTLVGTKQFSFVAPMKPGIARPMIMAKEIQKDVKDFTHKTINGFGAWKRGAKKGGFLSKIANLLK